MTRTRPSLVCLLAVLLVVVRAEQPQSAPTTATTATTLAARRSVGEETSARKSSSAVAGLRVLQCLLEANGLACARRRAARELDRMEAEVTGRSSETPVSRVIEEGGSLVVDGLRAIFGDDEDEDDYEEDEEEESHEPGDAVEESRKKKFGKKKKKHLHKLMMMGMLLKSKIGLLLQLFSTHLQVKFFIIAVIGLMINVARFWIDLKKSGKPSKVIYYEHAQHQHHYDHDDDHGGGWGRSSDEVPQELAYNAYVPDAHIH